MTGRLKLLILALAVGAAGCGSSSQGGCEINEGLELAQTAWPMFRKDRANTGRTDVDISTNSGQERWRFPPPGQTIGGISTTPILSADRIYLGSSDATVYVVDFNGVEVMLEFDITLTAAITGSPLIAFNSAREEELLFVVDNSGQIRQFFPDGGARTGVAIGGFISASPNIDDFGGVVYVGSSFGSFVGACFNAALNFNVALLSVRSSAAFTVDPNNSTERLIIVGNDSGQITAVNLFGNQRWLSFASAPITNAIVVDDQERNVFYVADNAGRVFSGSLLDGSRIADFSFTANAPITASPALGNDALYVADEGGTLSALDPDTGTLLWAWSLPVPGGIQSSPAVARVGDAEAVVVGADVAPGSRFCSGSSTTSCSFDAGCPAGEFCVAGLISTVVEAETRWTFAVDAPVGRSSPSVGSDGTVYIGTQGGELFAIGTPQ